jgi:hypothetical protein
MRPAGVVGDDAIDVAHIARCGSQPQPSREPSKTVALAHRHLDPGIPIPLDTPAKIPNKPTAAGPGASLMVRVMQPLASDGTKHDKVFAKKCLVVSREPMINHDRSILITGKKGGTSLFFIFLFAFVSAIPAQENRVLTASIVGHRLGDYPEITGDGSRVLILRIRRPGESKERSKAQFIIVQVQTGLNIPSEIFEDKKARQFTLVRSKKCDTSIEEFDSRAMIASRAFGNQEMARAQREKPSSAEIRSIVPLPRFIVPTTGAAEGEMPRKKKLRCYEFVGVSAEIQLQAGDEEKRPAVTIALECAEKDRFRFRIHNRTPWVISVPTYSNYFDWIEVNGTRRPRSVVLSGKGSVFVLPDDVGIDSLLYFLEREVASTPFPIRETRVSGPSSFNTSWIDKNSTIIFSIDKTALEDMRRLYVKFRYEWELSDKGGFFAGLNEHLAEFRLDPGDLRSTETCK